MKRDLSIPTAIKELLAIVARLHEAYPKKHFTLDGRLVGDIGECIAEGAYCVKVWKKQTTHYDGETSSGLKVQIKATMKEKGTVTFPYGFTPERYLAIRIRPDGAFSEIFNGPGSIAEQAVKDRDEPKAGYHTVSVSRMAMHNAEVPRNLRIGRRRKPTFKRVPLDRP